MPHSKHKVAILAHEQVSLFELGCAVELFGLARPEFDTWYECDVVSFNNGSCLSTGGIGLTAKSVTNLTGYTSLVIPSWPVGLSSIPNPLASEIIKFYKKGKRLLSFCSGAFLLGYLGILDNRKATTHWRYADEFKRQFTQTDYVDDVLYLFDGIIGCSAGSAAGIDLGIEVIRQDFGYHRANQVARRMVMSAHRKGGQSQFVETPVLKAPSQFSQALDWAMTNLTNAISIDAMSQKANMSRRTFDRKFRSTFNCSAKEWLTIQRLNLAKELLENEQFSVEKIADSAGFENAMSMRHHFRKVLGISPSQYKSQFSTHN